MTQDNAAAMAYAPLAPADADWRRQRIAAALQGSGPDRLVPFRDGYRPLPKVNVPELALLYRAANGRLIAQLAAAAHAQGSDLAALRERQESADVQAIIHGLLVAEAKDATGPIFQELERQAIQTEPLLVARDGVVINGNRRLAAMRELRASDSQRYAAFAEVRVTVLPDDCTAQDIEYIEAALQLAPETKLAYGWINRRLKLRHQLSDMALAPAAVVDAFRFESESAMQAELAELELAEDYLSHYRREPARYEAVADAEPLFVGLREQLAALSLDLRSLWRLAGFAMIAQRAEISAPLDRLFPFAAPVPPRLPILSMIRLAHEEGVIDDERVSLDDGSRERLAAILAERSEAKRLAPRLAAIMDIVRAEVHEHNAPVRMLKQLGQVRETLSALAPDRLTDKQRRQLKGDLIAIQAVAANLLGEAPAAAPETARAGLTGRLFGRRS